MFKDQVKVKIPKYISYLIREHNCLNIIDNNINNGIRTKKYLPICDCNDIDTLKSLFKNPNTCLLIFKQHQLGFILNKYKIKNIPLLDRYLNGSGQMDANYESFNCDKSVFKHFNVMNNKPGCVLINIDLEIDIEDKVLSLIMYRAINSNHQNYDEESFIKYLKQELGYKFCKDRFISDEIVANQIKNIIAILGITWH